jgi:hypothetical protein
MGLAQLLTVLVLSVGIGILHELVHGLAVVLCGGHPSYGVGMKSLVPYFYTTTDAVIGRNRFLFISVTPAILLSVLGAGFIVAVPALAGWAVIPLALNLAGSVGDVWATQTLLRYPAHVEVKDDKAGMTIYGRMSDVSLKRAPSRFLSAFLKGLILTFAAVFLLAVLLPIPLSLLGVKDFTLGTRQGIFKIESVSSNAGEISFVGVIALGTALGTLVGLTYAFVTSGRPQR